MATALPDSGKLSLPIQWSGTTSKTTMEAGGYQLSTTIGLNPYIETATFTWIYTNLADAKNLIDTMKTGHFNGTYSYTCAVMGPMVLRPTGSWSFAEVGPMSHTEVSIEFRRLK